MIENRYILQELKQSAYTYYEILDTYNNYKTVYRSKNYLKTINRLDKLELKAA